MHVHVLDLKGRVLKKEPEKRRLTTTFISVLAYLGQLSILAGAVMTIVLLMVALSPSPFHA